MFQRPGRIADTFPPPFPNDQAARAALGGALPPDMSVLAKARSYEAGFPWFIVDAFTQYQEDGPDYIHAILNGYADTPKGVTLAPGTQYNKYFPGHAIGMPKPLTDGQVEYTDGTPATRRPIRPRRRRLPDVGGGADARCAQAAGLPGDDFPDRPHRASVLHQEEGLARRAHDPDLEKPRAPTEYQH